MFKIMCTYAKENNACSASSYISVELSNAVLIYSKQKQNKSSEYSSKQN